MESGCIVPMTEDALGDQFLCELIARCDGIPIKLRWLQCFMSSDKVQTCMSDPTPFLIKQRCIPVKASWMESLIGCSVTFHREIDDGVKRTLEPYVSKLGGEIDDANPLVTICPEVVNKDPQGRICWTATCFVSIDIFCGYLLVVTFIFNILRKISSTAENFHIFNRVVT